jgi:hypothetical protein
MLPEVMWTISPIHLLSSGDPVLPAEQTVTPNIRFNIKEFCLLGYNAM